MSAAVSSVSFISVLRVFWKQAYKRLPYLYAVFVVMVWIEVISSTLLPLLGKYFIDTLVLLDGHVAASSLHIVGNILLVMIALRGIVWLLWRIGDLSIQHATSHIMSDLDQSALRYVLRHSYTFFTDTFGGSLVRRIHRLSHAYDGLADIFLFQIIPFIVSLIGIIMLTFQRSRSIGWAMIVWVCVFMLVNFFLAKWRMAYIVRRAEKDSEASGLLSDIVTNYLNIKLFSAVSEEDRRFTVASEELRRARRISWNMAELCESTEWIFLIAIEILILYIAIHAWSMGRLTIGDFVLFQSFVAVLMGKLTSFSRTIRQAYESIGDAKEMVDVLELPHAVRDARGAKSLRVKHGRIAFQRVTFRYHAGQRTLTGFDVEIQPYEKIALVGSSGAGKSTIVKLLFRFYDVTKGKILIDGQDIAKVTQDSLRDAIALVPQEPVLFHRTLMENIRYGRREATDDEVINAARLAHCHEFISHLPQGYETMVGERGVKLSGGERQRVAIARAILKNAPILVLDEATSSLDSESESLIQDALHTLMKNKTVIVIAHRLSTIMEMDRIIVMEQGRVVDEGTHDELLQKVGIYQKLWNIQAGGFAGEENSS